MARGDSLARQLKLMTLLEDRQELAVTDVARELGYTTRTVYRDLAILERIASPSTRSGRAGARDGASSRDIGGDSRSR